MADVPAQVIEAATGVPSIAWVLPGEEAQRVRDALDRVEARQAPSEPEPEVRPYADLSRARRRR